MNLNLSHIEVYAPQSSTDGHRRRKRGREPAVSQQGVDFKLQIAALERQQKDHIETIGRLTARLGDGVSESSAAALERDSTVQRLQAGSDQRDRWIGDWRNHCTGLQQEKASDALAYAESCRQLGASLAAATDNCTTLATQLLAAKDQATAATNERVAIDKELTAQMLKCSAADDHIRRANSAYRDLQGELNTARDSILRLTGRLEQANRQVSIYPALTATDGPAPAAGALAGPGSALADPGPALPLADLAAAARPRSPPDSALPGPALLPDPALPGPALPGSAPPGTAPPGPGTGIGPLHRAPPPAVVASPPRASSASPGAVGGRPSQSSPRQGRSWSPDSQATPPSPSASPQSLNRVYYCASPDLRTSSPDLNTRIPSMSPVPSSKSRSSSGSV